MGLTLLQHKFMLGFISSQKYIQLENNMHKEYKENNFKKILQMYLNVINCISILHIKIK